MKKVVGIRFHPQDKVHYFQKSETDFQKGEVIIVETELGLLAGRVDYVEKKIDENIFEIGDPSLLKKATIADLEKIKNYNEKREETLKRCREEVRTLELEMKLVDVAFVLDGSKIIFYFTAESRVDFRELVKNLTKVFQKSIRLQQIGSRDVTAAIGGYGLCGKELCCHKFLDNFESITTDMARSQQMAHRGSERISGLCGRLICCLEYEAKIYDELQKLLPRVGTRVSTEKGIGQVFSQNIIKQTVDVVFKDGERVPYRLDEIKFKK